MRSQRGMLLALLCVSLLVAGTLPSRLVGGDNRLDVTRFIDASNQLSPPYAVNGSAFDGFGSGVALGDYDNDGDVDIYFPNNGNPSTKSIFLNGSFPPGMGEPTNFVDPEGDGVANALYQNVGDTDGDGLPNFVNAAAEAGVEDRIGIGRGAVFADFDNDGDLDLYVANALRSVGRSEFGIHGPLGTAAQVNGFRDPGPFGFPPLFNFDSESGQLNGEFVVATDPVTGQPRGEGRNTLFRNMLAETGRAVFVDITDEAGDVGGTKGAFPGGRDSTSVAVADVNRDGFLDIYVTNFLDFDFAAFFRVVDSQGNVAQNGESLKFNGETNRLYINNGDMTFTDVTETAGVGTSDPFIFDITGTQRDPYEPELRDIDGNPVGEDATHSWTAAFDDFDQDGDPDIWVANDIPGTIELYRNDTPAGAPPDQVKFTLISRASGVDLIGAWMGFAFPDVNQDGVQDVFVSNLGATAYIQPNPTELNQQTIENASAFNRWTHNAFLPGLFRNDGRRTIRLGGKDQEIGVFPNITQAVTVEPSPVIPPRSSDPAKLNSQKRPIFGLGAYEFGFGAVAFDYNNDTHDDLYFIGSLGRPGGLAGALLDNPGRLLMGTGPNAFKDVSVEAHALDVLRANYANVDAGRPPAAEDRISTQFHEDGRAAISSDLNNDGFPDLVLTNGGGFDSTLPEVPNLSPTAKVYTPGPIFIFINQGNGNHWLKVRLIGGMGPGDPPNSGKSNRNGVGAYLRATVRTPAGTKVLVRAMRVGESYLASTNSAVHFGLGDADAVDTLVVIWPSGRVDVLDDVRANQTITIKEGQGIVTR